MFKVKVLKALSQMAVHAVVLVRVRDNPLGGYHTDMIPVMGLILHEVSY